MATIEERAKKHSQRIFPCNNEYTERRTAELAYFHGAKEQEEIDYPIMEEAVLRAVEKERKLMIEKACKILDERVAISGNRFDKHEDFMNDFRKRMEE